ncbi:MAG: hypothetical protein J5742_00040 [Alphaproteobacteria bacterium]|nr:hypothetical protein [Alphaproteobacteria bacterium]
MKKILLTSILAIVTGITISNADGDKKVTSKNYVDTQIGTRQATIPATGTNTEEAGSTVVTYTDNAGTIGERGICDIESNGDGECEDNYLVTRDLLEDSSSYLPQMAVTTKTCTEWVANASQTDENCLLWDLSEKIVYGRCSTSTDCEWLTPSCTGGRSGTCHNNKCVCYAR